MKRNSVVFPHFQWIVLGCLIHCLVGCSIFTSYPLVTRSAREAFYRGNIETALQEYSEEVRDNLDGLCYQLESGLVAYTGGNYQKSIQYFNMAEQWMESLKSRAFISASDFTENTLSVLVNDKTLPYRGEFFERTLLHTYQILNYIFLGNLEDARVEVQRALIAEEEAKDAYYEELEAAKEERSQDCNPELTNMLQEQISQHYRIPASFLGDSSNIYQLGCTSFLAGLVYEREGEYNDAYIEFKKLYENNPKFSYLIKNLYYLATKLGFREEAKKWENSLFEYSSSLTYNTGSIVVFYECDKGPYKKEYSFIVPTGAGFQKIAWPFYVTSPPRASHLELNLDSLSWNTLPLTDINIVAIRYHRDYSLARIVRMAIRLGLKIAAQYAAQKSVEKKYGKTAGFLAGFFVSVLTSVSEQADERCWMTLPRTIQALRGYLPGGIYRGTILIHGIRGEILQRVDLGKVLILPNRITFIRVRSIDNKVFWDIVRF